MKIPKKLMLFMWLLLAGNGWAADNWSLMDINGKEHRLSAYRGKWVLVNFWATWCSPCLTEIAEFTKLQQKHQNLIIIGVAEGYRAPHEVLDFVLDRHISYPIVLGNEDTAGDFGGINGTPTSFLYSPNGELMDTHEGPLTQEDIERKMR